jgi:hypothetical protein
MNLDSIDSERCLRDFNLVEQKLFNKQQVEKKFNIAELKLYPAVFYKVSKWLPHRYSKL